MTTLAEHIIVVGAENHPTMLEKSMYDSWASRIHLFIKGKKHGRMMLDSIDNGPLVYPIVEENGQTRPKKYFKLTEAQQLQDDCDVQETNIILHGLPPEVKLITDVKLAKSLYTTNYDHLYAYLSQHKRHANEVRINLYAPPIHHQHHHTLVNPQQHLIFPPPFISSSMTPQSQAEFPQLDSGLAVPMFQQGEDPIECINKAMAFLFVVASRFPPSNNQLRTSSNPRNQATIQYGRVTIQQVQERHHQSYAGIGNKRIATTSKGNVAVGLTRVVKCYNYQGEWHMARQYNLNAYDSDCDDLSSAKAILMANLSSYDLEVISEVPYSESYPNDMINQDVQEMQYSEQTHVDDFEDDEIHSSSNIISYSQYLQETQDAVIQVITNPSTYL
ncbi:hypothetical protein Tco_1082618 [Tanacetum coccineum]|uniref:Integrase, catalytic region, zinc finger, CCHC-type, peptidase aspartic, catalytic n=1 Tax=Tanacetum coccineum TaxID=301880 RepID=A0ABQ5I324_9ASTR